MIAKNMYQGLSQMNTMSPRNVCFIPTADLELPQWNKIGRSVINRSLLEEPIHQGFTHLLLKLDASKTEVLSGIGLTEEVIPTADAKQIKVLRLGLPFGSLGANHLGPLFSFLIRYSFRTWYKSGFQPLYWWTAANHQVYSLIARYSMRFYPSRRYLMLSSISWLQKRLGRKHFGTSFSTYTGTISATGAHSTFPKPLSSYEGTGTWLDQVEATQWNNPDYSYFMDINSGAIRGNTLLVLMPFTLTNMLVMQMKISLSGLKIGIGTEAKAWRTGLARFASSLLRRESSVDQMLSEEQRPI